MTGIENYQQTLLYITAILFLIFCYKRSLVYLRYFQQEEYDTKRFLAWMFKHRAFDKRGASALSIAILIISFLRQPLAGVAVLAALFLVLIISQADPRKTGKIKLNMTARASRIHNIALAIFILAFFALCYPCFYCHSNTAENPVLLFLKQALLIQFIPFTLIISNFLLSPFEKATKEKFKNEAKEILKRTKPYVIGITGSYGKTSVKSALGEVLNTVLAPTFCPPKSINTEMGITREIRENMKDGHKYAVIEMGAYNVGSIERLCKLTPPQAGLVTVVGMAHLERYGSVERVYAAKSELPKNVPVDGLLVCNGDDPGARRMSEEFPKKTTLLYGMNPESGKLDCFVSNISFNLEGTNFDLKWKDKTYSGQTKLLGKPALSNLLGVFTMACALGADPDFVLATIRNIKPVDNRLSLSKEGNVYFLRDAYNSNPLGFKAALDVLSKLPAKRKILMTPGMVELGKEQFSENRKAGLNAAKVCDKVILVGATNRDAINEGLKEGGLDFSNVIVCNSRDDAFNALNSMLQNDDMVLIENDLPDLYEMNEIF